MGNSVDVGSYVEVLFGQWIGQRGFVTSRVPGSHTFEVMLGTEPRCYAPDEIKAVKPGDPSSAQAPTVLAEVRSMLGEIASIADEGLHPRGFGERIHKIMKLARDARKVIDRASPMPSDAPVWTAAEYQALQRSRDDALAELLRLKGVAVGSREELLTRAITATECLHVAVGGNATYEGGAARSALETLRGMTLGVQAARGPGAALTREESYRLAELAAHREATDEEVDADPLLSGLSSSPAVVNEDAARSGEVPTSMLTATEIAVARAEGRMRVTANGLGFVTGHRRPGSRRSVFDRVPGLLTDPRTTDGGLPTDPSISDEAKARNFATRWGLSIVATRELVTLVSREADIARGREIIEGIAQETLAKGPAK